MRAGHGGPLFVCHANCCRSVLACYLYRHLCNNAPALSAGLEVGDRINDRAQRMLREWGIECKRTSALEPLTRRGAGRLHEKKKLTDGVRAGICCGKCSPGVGGMDAVLGVLHRQFRVMLHWHSGAVVATSSTPG